MLKSLFLAVIILGCVTGLYIWRKRIVAGLVKGWDQIAFFSLLGMIFVLFFPYLSDGIGMTGQLQQRLVRTEEIYENIRGFKKSDVTFLLAVFHRFLGFSVMTAYKMSVLELLTGLVFGCFLCLRRCRVTTPKALFATVIYALAMGPINSLYVEGTCVTVVRMVFMALFVYGFLAFAMYYKERKKVNSCNLIICGIGALGLTMTLWSGNRRILFSLFFYALLSYGTLFLIGWMKRKLSERCYVAIMTIFVVMVVGTALYQVNQIAFNTEIVKVYSIESLR